MKRMTILVSVIGWFILATACVQGKFEPLTNRPNTTASSQGGGEIQLQHEGIGPLEITPKPDGDERAGAPSSEQLSGNISSSGKRSTSEPSTGKPGQIESIAPEGSMLEQKGSSQVNWLTYHDQSYSFSISYPATYTILPESAKSMEDEPAKVHQVRFLENQLASGDTMEFEIPNFTIAVYELGNQSLEAFVANKESGGEREAYSIGDLAGFRVFYNQLIAPGEYFYFSDSGYVYKLTPLGSYSQEMLHSFRIE